MTTCSTNQCWICHKLRDDTSIQNAVHSQQAMNQITTAVVSKACQLIMDIGEST
ncbi:MAG: RebB family R body protein [Roseibium sp.]